MQYVVACGQKREIRGISNIGYIWYNLHNKMSLEHKNKEEGDILTGSEQYQSGVYTPESPQQAEKQPVSPTDELSSFEAFRAKYEALMQGMSDAQQREMYRKAVIKQQGKEAAERLKGAVKQNR